MFIKPSIKFNKTKKQQTDYIIIRKNKNAFVNFEILVKYEIKNFECCNILADYENFKIMIIFCNAITYGYFVKPFVKLFGIMIPISRVLRTFKIHSFSQSFPVKFEASKLKDSKEDIYRYDLMELNDKAIILNLKDMDKFIDTNDTRK